MTAFKTNISINNVNRDIWVRLILYAPLVIAAFGCIFLLASEIISQPQLPWFDTPVLQLDMLFWGFACLALIVILQLPPAWSPAGVLYGICIFASLALESVLALSSVSLGAALLLVNGNPRWLINTLIAALLVLLSVLFVVAKDDIDGLLTTVARGSTQLTPMVSWFWCIGFAGLHIICGQLMARCVWRALLLAIFSWYLWLRTWPLIYSTAHVSWFWIALLVLLLLLVYLFLVHKRQPIVSAYYGLTALAWVSLWLQSYPAIFAGVVLLIVMPVWLLYVQRISQRVWWFGSGSMGFLVLLLSHLIVPTIAARPLSFSLLFVLVALVCIWLALPSKQTSNATKRYSSLSALGAFAAVLLFAYVPNTLFALVNPLIKSALTANVPTKLVFSATHVTNKAELLIWLPLGVTILLILIKSVTWSGAPMMPCSRVLNKLRACYRACVCTIRFQGHERNASADALLVLGVGALVFLVYAVLKHSVLLSSLLSHLTLSSLLPDAPMLTSLALVATAIIILALCCKPSLHPFLVVIALACVFIWLFIGSQSAFSVLVLLFAPALLYPLQTPIAPTANRYPIVLLYVTLVVIWVFAIAAFCGFMADWFTLRVAPDLNMNLLLIARSWDVLLLWFVYQVFMSQFNAASA